MALNVRFDARPLFDAADAGRRRFLARFGEGVVRRARGSIHSGKEPSRPGEPPTSHVGKLPAGIAWAIDGSGKRVVAGIVPFGGSKVPRQIEKGGTVERPGQKPAHYAARPVIAPAFRAELGSISQDLATLLFG